MPKTDERAPVPALNASALERLTGALGVEGVVAALLFGSQARGQAGPLSDVDVAVWLDPRLDRQRAGELRLELADAAARALGTGEVDLVVLNGAPPLLGHRARREGRLILDQAPRERIRLETAALLEFLDTAPLRDELARGRRRRLAEGRFGRR